MADGRRVSRVWVVAVLAALWILLVCLLIANQEQRGDSPGSRGSGPVVPAATAA